MMEELIGTVSSGDVRMQDLASSLSSVVPFAAKAGISFAQVGGAIATMTSQNMSAQQATQDLGHFISALQNPNAVQIKEMQQLGLSSNTVAKNLGKAGLTGTINELTTAITSHMGKSGEVIMSAFQNAKQAAADANIEIKAMPSSLQTLAKGFQSGSISSLQWKTDLYGLSPVQANLMRQFASTSEKAHSFNSLLTSGSPAAQTFNAALSKMTGGQVSLKAALMLSGSNAATFAKNTADIAKQGHGAATMTTSWAAIQSTFNQKVDVAKVAVENTGIAIGTALLPAATTLFSLIGKIVVPIAEWTSKHKTLTAILFVGVTAIAATIAIVALAAKGFKAVKGTVDDMTKAYKGAVTALQKLGLISKKTSDDQAADSKKAAAAQEESSEQSAAAAETAAGEQEAASGEAAAAAEGDAAETAAANETAAAATSGSWLAAAASTVGGWAMAGLRMAGQAAVWVATNVAKVAVVVGANIAGALTTAGAWLAANAVMTAGIILVVALVAAAVYEIVKHWSDIVHGFEVAWNAVYDFGKKILTDIVDFVKAHWVLIVGIFLGPVALVVALVIKHFTQIKAFVSKIVTDVLDFIKSHWRLIVSILGGPLGLAVALVTKYWSDIKHWFDEGTDKVLSILRGLAHDVVSVGEDVVRGIWQGISGMGGWLWGQVKSFASNTLHSFESALGIGSPSRYTTVHGQMLGLGLANGIIASIPKVAAAAKMMSSAALGRTGTASVGSSLAGSAAGPAGSNSGGGTTIVIDVHGNYVMSNSDIDVLVKKIGTALTGRTLPQAGRQTYLR
jgi:hypothetical protein